MGCALGLAALMAGTVRPCAAQSSDSMLPALVRSAEDYLQMLAGLDAPEAWTDSAAVWRHLAQVALLLPDAVARQVAEGDLRAAPAQARLREGAGARLRNWWRRQDPLPASPVNERLLEHVQRVQHSEAHFSSSERPTGFDDRGEIYVLYGRPEREVVIRFDEPEFTNKLYDFGMVVNQSDFPRNVFWRYGHIDGTGNFLFLEQDGEYRIGGTTELLPRSLRTGFTPEKRGQRRAEMALFAMRTIYRQLAAEDPVFLDRFSQVDNYVAANEAPGRVAARTLGEAFRRAVLDQDDDTELQPGGSQRPASELVQSTITASKVDDRQMAYQREQLMPPTFTEVHRTLPPLPMGVRNARFLDGDGTTRTEMYWAPEPGALRRRDSQAGLLLLTTAVRLDGDYARRSLASQSVRIEDLPTGRNAVIPVQQTVLRGDTGLYHVALQWDLHRLREGGHSAGSRFKVGVHHVDSLRALDGTRSTLEMSDLRPVMIWSAADLVGPSQPYPFREVGTDVPLGLYFEVYNLRYGEQDNTHYSVTYQIARRVQQARRVGRRGRAPTSVTTRYTGSRSSDYQEVLLDLTDWRKAGPVTVTVTVLDLTANTSVTRAIEFELY